MKCGGLFFISFFIIISIGFQSCRSSKSPSSSSQSLESQKDDIIKRAKKQIGVKYKLGGSNSSGFDCSGFTKYCFEPEGIKLPPTSIDQSRAGKHIELKDAKKADLIFFKGGNEKSTKTGHVGIIIGGIGENLEFIHASSSKGIMISRLGEKYFKIRFIGIRRIIGVIESK